MVMINKVKFFATMLICIILNINMVWGAVAGFPVNFTTSNYSSGVTVITGRPATWTASASLSTNSSGVYFQKQNSGAYHEFKIPVTGFSSGDKVQIELGDVKVSNKTYKMTFKMQYKVGSSGTYTDFGTTWTESESATDITRTATINSDIASNDIYIKVLSTSGGGTNGGNHYIKTVDITYVAGAKTYTLKVPTGAGGSSYTTYSGKDKSWLTSTKALSGLSCNGDPNPINATYSGWRAGSLETPAASPGTTYTSSTADGSLPASGTTLYAVFQNNSSGLYYTNPVCKTYLVWYYGNGNTDGDEPWDDNEYDYGDVATVLGNSGDLEKTGYEFKGWATSSSATAADYVEDDKITISDDVELYAFWCKDLSTETAPTVNVSSATYNTTTSKWDITVTWTAVSGATYYKIACADLDASSYYLDPTDVGNVLTYNITGLTQGTNYRIRVQARNACGSTYKNKDLDYTPTCPTPGSSTLSTTSITSTGVTASWTSVSGASNYRVIITNEAKDARIGDAHDVTPPTTTSDFTGLTPNTNYYAALQISNACGESRTVWSSKFTTLQRYTLTYYKNDGGDDSQTAYKDHGINTTIKASNTFSRTGYTFQEWNTDDDGDGDSYTAGNTYSSNSDLTLYAIWEINSHTLAWNANGGDDLTGTYTSGSTDYNTALTAPDTPTRTGYTFTGWNSASNGTGDAYTGYMPDADVTYYAQWSINSHKVTISSVNDVTISATTPSASEGGYGNANYNSTVTLSYTGITSGLTWGGWRVYKDGDPSTTVTVNGSNEFTMPDYDVIVSAVLYGDVMAWCDPDISITGSINLTSYNGVYVNSTSTTGDLLNIASTNLEGVTSLQISYLNESDEAVALTSSRFRLCNDGSVNYNIVDPSSAVTSFSIDVSAGNTCDLTYSIRYTPNAYNQIDNWKLRVVMKKGSDEIKTVTHNLNGRALPQKFVIAAQINGQWCALPADLATSSGTTIQDAYPITVNNDVTAAVYAPKKALYSGAARNNATKHLGGIRLNTETGTNDGHLQAPRSNSLTYLWRTSNNCSTGMQEWYLKSTDLQRYNIGVDPSIYVSSGSGGDDDTEGDSGTLLNRYLCVFGNKIMWSNTEAKEFRILPVTNEYTDVPATASEWGAHGVIVQPTTPSDLSSVTSATMNVGTADPTAATTTAVNAAMGAAKRVKVDGGALTVGAVANEGKLLYIHWKNSGGTEIGVSQILIPRVIATDGTMSTIESRKTYWNTKEVHVLPGVTLTADAGTFSDVTIAELHIYPGATLKVTTGTLTATTLRLRNGWTRAGTKKYDVARVYIADDAALTHSKASMDYDIYELTDGKHYYPLAVPFTTAIETLTDSIDYADPYLAKYSKYGATGQYVIKEYDGERRAESGADQANNWKIVAKNASLSPGKGYIMTAVAVKGEAIIRIPLIYNDAWTADGELGTATISASTVRKDTVHVTAYTGTAATAKMANKGWNLVGVPYMSCFASKDNIDHDKDGGYIKGKLDFITGEYSDTENIYVTVPTHNFSEYLQYNFSDGDTKLLPGWCFFVQIDKNGRLTFDTEGEASSSSLPIYAPKRETADMPVEKTGIILSDGDKSDKTTIIVSDKYSAADYEINADLEKMFGNGYTLATYSLSGSTRLAYNAMSQSDAQQVIPIGYRAPAEGEYTFSINPRYAESGAFSRVDLIDYAEGTLTNLLTSSYTFTTGRTQNDSRFAINLLPRQETPTDVEMVSGEGLEVNGVQKVIINDHMYIIRGGLMYDATGKVVKGGQK